MKKNWLWLSIAGVAFMLFNWPALEIVREWVAGYIYAVWFLIIVLAFTINLMCRADKE